MTPTPEPEPQSGRYPAIPSGKGLLYVINFHGDEVQFRFIDRPEQYVIPGKQVAPEGGVLELFIDPGSYGWVGEIPFANLKGEGALDVVEGQIQGLGLVQGKLGSQDVIEGFPIGSDPLAPPVAPTPTPPTPSPNKALLLLRTDIAPGDVTFRDQHYPLEVGQTLTLELDPGFYDINFTFLYACELEGCPLQIVNNHQVELQSNSVCELFADKEPGGAFTLQCQ
jgi:hypothetical protein